MMAIPESDDIPSIVRDWVSGCNWRAIRRVLRRRRMGCRTLEGMDKTIRKYVSFDEMKTDDYWMAFQSFASEPFWQLYRELPPEVQHLADKQYEHFREDPF